MKCQLSVCIVGAIVAMASARAYEVNQNLLQNPDFGSDLGSWVDEHNTSIWVPDDYEGLPRSGAALVGVPALQASHLTQCVNVASSETYIARAWVLSTCGSDAELDLYWAEGCAVTATAGQQSVSSANTWSAITLSGKAPKTADTAIVALTNNGACHENVYFDAVSLLSNRIFADGFDNAIQSQ